MAAQDHNGGRSPRGVPTRADHPLDSLARGLASGTVSRRTALRWMGSALVGAALPSIPGVAWAKPKPGKCNRDEQCPTGQACVGGQCVCSTIACEGGMVNSTTCECECPPNMAFHHLSGRCVSAVCQAEDAQRCAENPEPDTLCCPAYLESGEPTGFFCCPESWTCNVNHGSTMSACTPP
jgi:hypothetical protein